MGDPPISANAYLRTPGARESIIYRGPLPAKLPPASALGPRDRLDLSVRSQIIDENSFTFRAARRQVLNTTPSPVTLWDPVAGLQLGTSPGGDSQATWSSLQPYSYLSYLTYDVNGVTMDHLVSSSYLAAAGGHQVVLATDAPGFGADWRPDLANCTRSFLVIREGTTRYAYQHDESEFEVATTGRNDEAAALRARALSRHRFSID